MGYRSDGAIRIVGPKDRMLAELGTLALLGDEYIRDALKEFVIEADGKDEAVLGLNYEGWKWYLDYADIQAFEKIWRHFEAVEDDKKDLVFCGAFIRFGESDDDTEHRMFGEEAWKLITLSRGYQCEHTLDSQNDLRNNRLSFFDRTTI